MHHDHRLGTLGEYTQYTAHEATLLPVADWPLWAWHRARPERPSTERWAAQNSRLIAEVFDEFRATGPRTASFDGAIWSSWAGTASSGCWPRPRTCCHPKPTLRRHGRKRWWS